jgi:hypothetical protein
MRQRPKKKTFASSTSIRTISTVSLLFAIGAGCGSAPDDRFKAQTWDEYTEPLANATIVNGDQVIVIPAATPPGKGDAGLPPIVDAGPPLGTGGSTGVGGSGGSGFGGSGFSGGGPGGFDGGIGGGGPSGFWQFDDCSPTSNFLMDSSGNHFSAQHALKSKCVAGISGQGIQFSTTKDIVQVPDEPEFTVSSRIAVAAWVNPTTTDGDLPIVLKRENNQTAFSLGIHKGNIEMAVTLTDGHTFISQAPIQANVWTHVAGMYDGRFLFLFINGEQFGQVFGGLNIRNAFAPIRIGATTQSQSFKGIIDEVWVSTNAVSKDELTALACISRPSTFTVTPQTSGPVPPGTTVPYLVTVSNHDIGACQTSNYEMFITPTFSGGGFPGTTTTGTGTGTTGTSTTSGGVTTGGPIPIDGPTPIDAGRGGVGGSTVSTTVTAGGGFGVGGSGGGFGAGGAAGGFGAGGAAGGFGTGGTAGSPGTGGAAGSSGGGNSNDGITTSINPPFFFGVAPGSTVTFEADVTGSEDADPGVHQVPFTIENFGSRFEELFGNLVYELTEPTGCFVRTKRELMITNTSVVDDPVRTQPGGAWTFGNLIRNMAPTPADAPALAEQLLKTWLTDQTVNGFTIPARPAMQQTVLDQFPRMPDGSLDIDHAPLRLLAIVNRFDLRNLAAGNAGEGRFVFGVLSFGFPLQFTMILEYKLPAQTPQDVQDWANLWHGLSSHPFPSDEYNAALEVITRRFSDRGAAPGRVNGSALGQLRTNEIALSFRWEFREFTLSPTTGFLVPSTVKLTPDLGFNGTQTLADYITQNEASIITETHTVPEQFEGNSFLGASVFNDLIFWQSPTINFTKSEARFEFSKNTCNGCHGPETNTTFLQITPRGAGQEAPLSPFLMGTTVFDPFTNQPRTLNDLSRRNADLTGIVCTPPPPAPGAPAQASPSLVKGSQRVH